MTRSTLLWILVSVALSSLAQIALKAGVRAPSVGSALGGADAIAAAQAVAGSPMVWAGLGLYGLSMGVWLLVLARVDVSLAYPFVGLGFVMTMLLAWGLHGEPLTPSRVAGTLLIVCGVAVLGRS